MHGRDATIARLLPQVKRGRSLAIVGAPCVGKAALARVLARRSGRRFVEVEPVAGSRGPEDAEGLLFLHAPAGFDPTKVAGVRPFIVAARAPFDCGVETFHLDPLSPTSATQLFARRIGAPVASEAQLAFCGGLPGVIVSAAERAKITTLAHLPVELAQGIWEVPAISETLASLTPGERATLATLARLSPIDLEQANRMLKHSASSLRSLRARGLLVEADGAVSVLAPFALVVRARAPRTVDTQTRLVEEAVRRRHQHYLGSRPTDLAFLRRHRMELLGVAADPRAEPSVAARATLAVEPLLTTNGSMLDNLDVLTRAAHRAAECDDPALQTALGWATAKAWLVRGCYRRSLEVLEPLDQVASRVDDPSYSAHAYIAIGHAHAALGESAKASAYLREAETWAYDASLVYEGALARIQFAHLKLCEGDGPEAVRLADDTCFQASGLARIVAIARACRGSALSADAPQRAQRDFAAAAEVLMRFGETAQAIRMWGLAARAAQQTDGLEEGLRICGLAQSLAAQTQDKESALWIRLVEAEIQLEHGRLEAAQRAASAALGLATHAATPASLRMLAEVRHQLEEAGLAVDRGAAVELDATGRAFTRDGNRVSLNRRAALRRILAKLVSACAASPGTAVGVDTLYAVGWPDQPASVEARRRVYTAVWTLRKLGLVDAIETIDDGYALDPTRVRIL